jgi:hypothetical protein
MFCGLLSVDILDLCVRVWTAQDRSVQQARQLHIVQIPGFTPDQTRVFLAFEGSAN